MGGKEPSIARRLLKKKKLNPYIARRLLKKKELNPYIARRLLKKKNLNPYIARWLFCQPVLPAVKSKQQVRQGLLLAFTRGSATGRASELI